MKGVKGSSAVSFWLNNAKWKQLFKLTNKNKLIQFFKPVAWKPLFYFGSQTMLVAMFSLYLQSVKNKSLFHLWSGNNYEYNRTRQLCIRTNWVSFSKSENNNNNIVTKGNDFVFQIQINVYFPNGAKYIKFSPHLWWVSRCHQYCHP